MSDPVTNVEIEDVLSSIRRLVSEDTRTTLRRAPPETEEAQDRLVLTPSFRVASPPVDEPEVEDTDDVTDEAPWRTPETTLFGAAAVQEAPSADTWTEQSDGFEEEDQISEPAADQAEKDGADDGPDHSAPEDGIAEGETSFDTIEQPELVANHTDLDTDQSEDVADGDTAESQDDEPGEHPDADASEQHTIGSFGDKIAALEAAIAQTKDQWEPDDAGSDEYAGTEVETLDWEDHTGDADQPDLKPADHAEVAVEVPDEDPEPIEDFLSDETILDEDSLRELVSDIVREELQGALGERITRNVRKLVRREIHRALAVQELE